MRKFLILLLLFGCIPNQEDLDTYYNEVIINKINYDREIDSIYNIYGKYDVSDDIYQLDKIIKQIYLDKIDSLLIGIDTLYKPIDVNTLFPY